MTLPNRLHEEFARVMAEGLSPTEAYYRLKPRSRHPSVLGSRLWNRQEIRIRIAEIAEEATNEKNLPIKTKLELLEGQIRGEIPTKVIDRGNGQKEEVYDMLGAIAAHSRICGDAITAKPDSYATIRNLQFNIVGRNEELTPKQEAENRTLQN